MAKNPILIGSIIHLENVLLAGSGGYLNILKQVDDDPQIQLWPDPNVRAFVATHESEDGAKGSGSWQILSVDGRKRTGEELAAGDKIHLLNMQSGTGYLDSFEWVERFQSVDGEETFPDYPMEIGVFTSKAERGEGVSGTWTIHAAAAKELGDTLVEGDVIELENAYPGAGFLYSYGEDGGVTKHKEFEGKQTFEGQCLFVFTGPKPPKWSPGPTESASKRWKVTLSAPPEYLYRVTNQRVHNSVPLSDGGIFKIVDSPDKRVTALRIISTDQGQTLFGTVCYNGEGPSGSNNFQATHQHLAQNDYEVTINGVLSSDRWRLGARDAQRVIAINIHIDRDEGTLKGQMIYTGEAPINIVGKLEIRRSDDVPQPGWVKGRTNRVESAIVENHRLLATYFASIGAISIYHAFTDFDLFIPKFIPNEDKPNDTVATELANIPASFALAFDPLDREFQIEQLLNLNSLSLLLNSFFRYTLHALMVHSLEKHRQEKDGTLAPLHLFRKCFQQVAIDHEIIQKAIVQRQWDLDRKSMGKQAEELLKMDKLAIKAITPFRELLLGDTNADEPLAVITYLDEKTHIHLVPYTKQFILIGISYDRVPPAASIFGSNEFLGKDFYAYEIMAIPHEVGHYIYQHGRFDSQTFPGLSQAFEGNPYYQWCEEIFADVYSCIVAGPLAAISMQALLMSIDRDRAWKDDEEHPTPVLRVFIFAEILRILHELMPSRYNFKNGQNGFNITDKLDQDWAKILKLWRYAEDHPDDSKRPVRVYIHDNSTLHLNTIVNVDRVIMAIRPIIEKFAACLLSKAEFGGPTKQNTAGQNTTEQNTTDGQNTDGLLAMKIPWTDKNFTTTGPYNDVMTSMTDRDFARKKVSSQLIFNPTIDEAQVDLSNPDEQLQQYLKEWGDSGPISGGGSGGTKGPLFQLFF